jgi:hypothetical protein
MPVNKKLTYAIIPITAKASSRTPATIRVSRAAKNLFTISHQGVFSTCIARSFGRSSDKGFLDLDTVLGILTQINVQRYKKYSVIKN